MTIGAGGLGGSAVSGSDANGNPGLLGGASQFGTYFRAALDPTTIGGGPPRPVRPASITPHATCRPDWAAAAPQGAAPFPAMPAASFPRRGRRRQHHDGRRRKQRRSGGLRGAGSGFSTSSAGGTAPGGAGTNGAANVRLFLVQAVMAAAAARQRLRQCGRGRQWWRSGRRRWRRRSRAQRLHIGQRRRRRARRSLGDRARVKNEWPVASGHL